MFFLYVAIYTLGRLWIEMLRIDEAEMVLGLRLNVWTSLLVLLGGTIAFVLAGRREVTPNSIPEDQDMEVLVSEVEEPVLLETDEKMERED